MKRKLLAATILSLFLARAASAQTIGVVVVPVSPVQTSPEMVSAIYEALATEFPGAEIRAEVHDDPTQTLTQDPASMGWDYVAVVRLGVGKAKAGAAFAGSKMTVESVVSVEIADKAGSVFNQEFNGQATGKALFAGAPNVKKIYIAALKEALSRFQEAH